MCALHALIEVCGPWSCVHARDANARAARDYRAARARRRVRYTALSSGVSVSLAAQYYSHFG